MNRIQLLLVAGFTVAVTNIYGQHKAEVTLTTAQPPKGNNAGLQAAEVKGGASIFDAVSRNSTVVVADNVPQATRIDYQQKQVMSTVPVIENKSSSKNISEKAIRKDAQ